MRRAVLLSLALAAPAQAAEPTLTTPRAQLRAALTCQPAVAATRTTPVLLLHGTGNGGRDEWAGDVDFQGVVTRAGHASCVVELPKNALVDVQTSAEYVVFAARSMRRLARRPIAIYGHSQGGLLAQWTLAYWPSLRRKVSDVVSVAGPHRGTTWGTSKALVDPFCSPLFTGCPAAFRQQTTGSQLLAALARRADPTPGPTRWATVRTLTDELVQPQDGPAPASALAGATDVVVQDVCPGREVGHSAVQYDTVAFAVLRQALRRRGSVRPDLLPDDVCAERFAGGLEPSTVTAREYSSRAIAVQRALAHDQQTTEEPPVRRYAG